MALILSIETATNVCSAALAENGKVIAFRELNSDDQSHAVKLTVFIDEIFKETAMRPSQLDAVAVSKGPGSFTGLRIGVSAAKGIAFGADKPLIAINTLETMAAEAANQLAIAKSDLLGDDQKERTLLCPMIDARRMECYHALFTANCKSINEISATIIDENSFSEILEINNVVFFGSGALKCQKVIQHPNAIFLEGIYPLAKTMAQLSELAFQNKQFVDVAYFEPFYLKDFVVTTSKKNIFLNQK